MKKKLLTGGIALSLLIGGGAISAFAAGNAGTQTAPVPTTAVHKSWDGKWGKGNGQGSMKLQAAAEVLGMTSKEVAAGLKSGKSLADLAKEKNITEDALISGLVKKANDKLDKAVADGKLTKEKADAIRAKLADRIKTAVERKGLPDKGFKGHHGRGGMPLVGDPGKVAAIIGIPKADLEAELKAGKSLAEVAQAHGMTKDQLVAKLKDAMTPMLEKMVDSKHVKGQNDQKQQKQKQPKASGAQSGGQAALQG